MGTQGVVSILLDGRTLVKAVAGCQGQAAEALAAVLDEHRVLTAEDVQTAAVMVGFGCRLCLVVMDKDGMLCEVTPKGATFDRYQNTFSDPYFNPRWDSGTASEVHIVRRMTDEPGQ